MAKTGYTVFLRLRRTMGVFRVLAVHGVRTFFAWVRPGRLNGSGPRRLRILIEDLGGTFIKFGQVLSLQPDALPIAYCNALFDLLDRVPPFSYQDAETTFVEDLGCSPDAVFDDFEREPIASASIGQVHRARLGGRTCAVKVRRPTVEEDFAADVLLMRTFARILDAVGPERWKWLVHTTREFCAWTHEELDYRYEARFMDALGENAKDNPREKVPGLVDDLSGPRILVAEYLEGPMVLDYIRELEGGEPTVGRVLEELSFNGEEFARNIVRNFISDAFRHGIFHADLHPANLLILPDNVVGYVDFGITGTLSPYSRRNIVSLTLALTRADVDGMMTRFLNLAMIKDDSDIHAFREGLEDIVQRRFDHSGERPRLKTGFNPVMMDILRLCRRTNVWTTPDSIRYMRSVITADGLISRFAPGLDVSAYLESVCVDYVKETLWRRWAAPERWADLLGEGVLLLEDGPRVARRFMDGARKPRPPAGDGRDEGNRLRQRAARFAVLAFFPALLAWLGQGPCTWGLNLFSAEILLSGIAGVFFLRTAKRLI